MSESPTPLADALWNDLERRLAPPDTPTPLRLLFASDGSEPAGAALEFVKLLPLPAGSQVQVVSALEGANWLAPASLLTSEQETAAAAGEQVEAALSREGVKVGCSIPTGPAASEILRSADAFQPDLIVLGSHGRTGLPGFLIGSVARNVAKHAKGSVLIARAPRNELRRVLVAIDESPHAPAVVEMAAHLPLPPEAELVICHVVRPYVAYAVAGMDAGAELDLMVAQLNEKNLERGRSLVGEVEGRIRKAGRTVRGVLRRGDPAAEIRAAAREEEADLIIAGTRGVSVIEGLLLGSVADRLLHGAECSLLLVRPPGR